jgi:hypothetical protein
VFKNVEDFIGRKRTLRSINPELLKRYQEERRKQISPTMKRPGWCSHRELRAATFARHTAVCKMLEGNLTKGYQPLRQKRRRVGRVATKDELMNIIATAKTNEYWELAMYCAAVAAGTRTLSPDDEMLLIIEAMGVLALLTRHTPKDIAEERTLSELLEVDRRCSDETQKKTPSLRRRTGGKD